MIERIISGGQTGVDRAALDAARARGLPCGGWCPKGRKAEDGPLAARYPLIETPSDDYAQRTEWNIRDSDGTLVLTDGELSGGTAQTVQMAVRFGKPYLVLDLSQRPTPESVLAWAITHQVHIVNVAGPRESKSPGIYDRARQFLNEILSLNKEVHMPTPQPERGI